MSCSHCINSKYGPALQPVQLPSQSVSKKNPTKLLISEFIFSLLSLYPSLLILLYSFKVKAT